ncbi:hypothetical protein [Streptomyces mirabilis]
MDEVFLHEEPEVVGSQRPAPHELRGQLFDQATSEGAHLFPVAEPALPVLGDPVEFELRGKDGLIAFVLGPEVREFGLDLAELGPGQGQPLP